MRFVRGKAGILSQLVVGVWIFGALFFFIWIVQRRSVPDSLSYGVSFSKLHADELGLNWKEAYVALLDELGVRRVRLSAHWTMIEPERDSYDFSALDFQMQEARERNVSVILALGKKAPGWPECHIPKWVGTMPWDEQKEEIRQYIGLVVNRYKDYPNLQYWQVENEPFLDFARHLCGDPDEAFIQDEVLLVREIDPLHPILLTDGGEFGTWHKARKYGDIFGSTLYVYVWTQKIGYWRYPINAAFFRAKLNIVEALFGTKPSILAELGLEPWLNSPIVDASIEEQLLRMNIERFDEIIALAAQTSFQEQYLWGAEWWYYMKLNGHPEFWQKAKALIRTEPR